MEFELKVRSAVAKPSSAERIKSQHYYLLRSILCGRRTSTKLTLVRKTGLINLGLMGYKLRKDRPKMCTEEKGRGESIKV